MNNLHAVFGLLLWIMVVMQFRQRARSTDRAHVCDLALLSRQLSRAVYILLYMVFGADQIIRTAASRPAIPQPAENLRGFLAYGIIALLTIRVLAAVYRVSPKRAGLTSTPADFQQHK
jgi:cytochrome b561